MTSWSACLTGAFEADRPKHSLRYILDEREDSASAKSLARVAPQAPARWGFPYVVAPVRPASPLEYGYPQGRNGATSHRRRDSQPGRHDLRLQPPEHILSTTGSSMMSSSSSSAHMSTSPASSTDSRFGALRSFSYHGEPQFAPPSSSVSQPVADQHTSHSRPVPRATRTRAKSSQRTAEQKRLARQCTVDDCTNYTIDRGLCFRHGGGKTCSIDGCASSAKARGLCWRHGGSILCTITGCGRGAKSRGLCWTHGGGTKCSVEGCEKTTISKGLCWTHGGGKRCSYEGCKRPASEKKQNFCPKHFRLVSRNDFVYEI